MAEFRAKLIGAKPKPIFLIEVAPDANPHSPPFNLVELFRSIHEESEKSLRGCVFRGVSLERLNCVLQYGIDVQPTDAVIFADNDLSKAWEYGGFPKLILAMDRSRLERTWREVPVTTPPSQLQDLQRTFPTSWASADGKTLYFSRLTLSDPQLGTSYEWTHALWIPGNPVEALRALMIFARKEDCPFRLAEDLLSRAADFGWCKS
jgi:hypothetical protein